MSSGYSLREVVEILGLPRSVIAGFVDAGFVAPRRGARREYRFGFADLVVMRVAKSLLATNIPAHRVTRALKRLRSQLPEELPREGLRIESDGGALVLSQGGARWRPDTGQYVLSLEVASTDGAVAFVERPPATGPGDAAHWLSRASELEAVDVGAACAAYQQAIAADPAAPAAHVNLGRVLHEAGRLIEARNVYENALAQGVVDPTLLFNLGVLLEDLGDRERAVDLYRQVLDMEPTFADAHYNLALLCASAGDDQRALRHFNAYRQLSRANRGEPS